MMYESLERKIAKKRKSYQDHREKLMVEFADLFYVIGVCVVIAASFNVLITV